jgi:hypothetical protein
VLLGVSRRLALARVLVAVSCSVPTPAALQDRLAGLAVKIASGERSASVPESVAIACDLVAAGSATGPVVAVAALSPAATWRDSGDQVLAMLESLGLAIPEIDDETAAWPLILHAFGFCNLPFAEFYGPFHGRLPASDKQDPLDRSLNLLLDEWEHCCDPRAQPEIVERMRAAVRESLT